jgi:hypothetical protein
MIKLNTITVDDIDYTLPPVIYDLLTATADEVESLRVRNDELKGALKGLLEFSAGKTGHVSSFERASREMARVAIAKAEGR